ncbi:MAG: GNAT family N-acetyltransferase [Bacteroidota bacterium]
MMKITEVTDRKSQLQFLNMVDHIYAGDPFYVRPLDQEIESVFNPEKNGFFRHGEAIRWILTGTDNKVIGRVAAFINKRKAFTFQQPTGGMGFFECTDNREAAFLLFDQCREWLAAREMKAMDGPINFGENDVNWGLLVEGFIHPGFGMSYNPSYYRDFFEVYGFKFYFEQVSNHLDLTKPFPERFWKIAEWCMKKPELSFRHFTYGQADQFIRDMKEIYDDAWKFHENFTPMDESTLRRGIEKAKSFADPEMIWFAYHGKEPAAFLIQFPDVNQILKHLHGKLHLWNKLKFLYLKNKKTITRSRIVIMGVKPKFQRYGLESGIFWHLNEKMKKKPQITEVELSWVGDFNPKMRALHESVGATFAKRHITYRKIFSDDAAFHRSTIIPVDTKEKALRMEEPLKS